MKKHWLLLLLLLSGSAFAQKNIQLLSKYPFPQNVKNLANICGYAAKGREYALVGTSNGMTIIEVTDPKVPVKLFDIPGVQSLWREVKTYKQYAYVTTEGANAGLQIVDMSQLPDTFSVYIWKGDGEIKDRLSTIHALHIDKEFVYLYGTNRDLANGGIIIADLKDPIKPHYVGKYNSNYVHDGFVRNDTVWAGQIYDGNFTVIDAKDKTSLKVLASHSTPNLFTHNTWLSDNGKTLLTTDEVSWSYLASYDVSDINNIQELDRIRVEWNNGAIIHNTHFLNNYAINSWYKEGVAIVDVSRPANMIVVGQYDTSPLSGDGYDGAWGVYPYLPSGNLIVSDMSEGLFVLKPTYKRGCYLEGVTRDSITNLTLMDVDVEIVGSPYFEKSRVDGVYKTGVVDSGKYTVKYTKQGYYPRILNNVLLTNGKVVTKNVKLLVMPTGVAEVNEDNNWNVFADCELNELKISYPSNSSSSSNYQFVVTDIIGKTVASIPTSGTTGHLTYNTQQLPTGIYVVQMYNEQQLVGARKVVLK